MKLIKKKVVSKFANNEFADVVFCVPYFVYHFVYFHRRLKTVKIKEVYLYLIPLPPLT